MVAAEGDDAGVGEFVEGRGHDGFVEEHSVALFHLLEGVYVKLFVSRGGGGSWRAGGKWARRVGWMGGWAIYEHCRRGSWARRRSRLSSPSSGASLVRSLGCTCDRASPWCFRRGCPVGRIARRV